MRWEGAHAPKLDILQPDPILATMFQGMESAPKDKTKRPCQVVDGDPVIADFDEKVVQSSGMLH